MIIQGLNSIAAAYGSAGQLSISRQTLPAGTATLADKVSISAAAKALADHAQASDTQNALIQQRLAEIKAAPAVERTAADHEYLLRHDTRYNEIQQKMQANAPDGFDTLTADEVDYLQKSTGFVNTMSYLSPGEKALYDEMVAKGKHEAAHGLLLVGMSRIGMSGQQVTLPNGRTFDPTATEVTADNIRNLFKRLFVAPNGNTDRQFEALASYLDKRETTAS